MTRSIPPSLARLVEQLELERPAAVSVAQVAEIIARTNVRTPPRVAIQRLAKRGWLLRTGVRGTWEFAPADRAGAFSANNPLLPVQAFLLVEETRRPRDASAEDGILAEPPTLALASALWLHDLLDRAPERPELAVSRGMSARSALRRHCRLVHFRSHLRPVRKGGVYVHSPATVLVHLAHRPQDVRSWASILEHLGRLVAAADPDQVREELAGRPAATRARLAYLVRGVAPAWAERLYATPRGRIWFGPRQQPKRYDPTLRIVDTVLPVAPADLAAAGATG